MPRKGGRRIKTKTHVNITPENAVTLDENNQPINQEPKSNVPRSIVAKGGEDDVVEMRHYAIRANPVGITKGIKKLVQGKIANLGELQDISEYVESGGAGLLSDSEAEDEESKIVLPDRFNGKGNFESQQSAMKLTELGPRMTLELFKVESGLGEGDVLYHKYVQKSVEEAAALKQRIESQKALKEERRKTQEENVQRKRQLEDEKIQLKLERKRQKYGDKDGN
eukprot:gene24289-31593_t